VAGLEVLLVEDSPGDAELISDMLQQRPAGPVQVTLAPSLAVAGTLLHRRPFDAVLLDLHLPDGVGLECLASIRGHSPSVPVVVLTGMGGQSFGPACIVAGAQDYLSKDELGAVGLCRSVEFAVLRSAEQAQRQRTESLLAAIVAASHDAIVSSTPEGRVTSWNRGAERIFGYSAEEAIGQPVGTVIAPPPEDAARPGERRVFLTRRAAEPTQAEEVVRLRRDGTRLTLNVATGVIVDAQGHTVALTAILRDLTASRQRDAELFRLTRVQAARERRMTALVRRLRRVEEEERTRMSRQVHDGVGQLLTALKLDLRWLARRVASGHEPAALLDRLAQAEALVDDTIGTVQKLALDLRPSALDALGLPAALRDEARRFGQRSGLQVQVDVSAASAPRGAAATAFFRILQELLSNVARHAQATEVQVGFRAEEGVWVLEVCDNGVGFGDDCVDQPTSLGLLGMTERAEGLGGSFTIGRHVGGGTCGVVVLPQAADSDGR
jgi:two-component system sensor histidine kinase UhpB